MYNDVWGAGAIGAMAAAKACYEQIPDQYDGKGHLGLSIAALDQLVARVITLHDRLDHLPGAHHG